MIYTEGHVFKQRKEKRREKVREKKMRYQVEWGRKRKKKEREGEGGKEREQAKTKEEKVESPQNQKSQIPHTTPSSHSSHSKCNTHTHTHTLPILLHTVKPNMFKGISAHLPTIGNGKQVKHKTCLYFESLTRLQSYNNGTFWCPRPFKSLTDIQPRQTFSTLNTLHYAST